MYKVENKLVPETTTSLFTKCRDTDKYDTHSVNAGNFDIPVISLTKMKLSIIYLGHVEQNTLPNNINEVQSLDSFQVKLKYHLLNHLGI